MKNLLQRFFLFSVVALLASVALNAQVQIGPINYTTLKAAFDAINNGVHTGNITIDITGNTVETATAVLNRSGSGSASYTAVNIYTTGVDTVYGNASISPVVRFADADNITIDGRIGQTGSTNSLTFASLNTAGTVIWIDSTAGGNGAKNILIRHVNILGASATTTNYGINVSSSSSQTTGAPGFNNIQILNCNFARTYYGVNIRGGSSTTQYATNIVVRFNNFGQNAAANMANYYGVYMQYVLTPIIRNNYFSYNSTSSFYAVYLSTVPSPNVSDNILENTTASSSIYFLYGSSVGSITTGGVGATVNSNIMRNITSTGSAFYGINLVTAPNSMITNNIIENANIYSTLYPIYLSSANGNIVQNNIIRNLSTSLGTFYGIYLATVANGLVSNNRVENITAYYSMAGMYLTSVTASRITDNIISNLNQTYASTSYYQVGMLFMSSCNNDTVINNSISRIRGSVTSANSAMYSPSGIQIQGGANWSIWHNSVYLNGTHANTTQILPAALTVTSTSATNLNIRNNVFVNAYVSPNTTSKSYAIYLAGTANLGTINYNDYYVSGPNAMLGFLGADAADIVSWRALSAQDVNSISGDPIFNGLTNLMPYTGSPLVAAGTPIALVSSDIRGVTRSTTAPTIGAYEEAGDIDAPEVLFTSIPNVGSGVQSQTLIATISDVSGVHPTNLPRLYFRKTSNANTYIDNTNATNGWKYAVATSLGGNQYQFVINHNLIFGGLSQGDTVQYFIVASDNFTNPNIGVYGASLASQITSVALTATEFPATNLSYFYRVLPSFSGDIEVGAGQTFTTLTGTNGLFASLNNAVITGNITVKIVSNINEPGTVALGEVASSGGTFTITIRPWGAPRTLSFNNDGACLLFNGTDRLTIDGRLSGFQGNALTITNTVRTNTHQIIHIAGTATNGATNITIRNVNIRAGHPAITNTTNTYGILVATSAAGQVGTNHNISLLENKIERAYFGIRIMGASPGLNGIIVSKNYIGNDIDSLTVVFKGIHLENTNAAQITYNTLRNIKINTSANIAAIDLASGTFNNTYIYGNKIQGVANPASGGWGAYGINVASSTTYNTYIINNMISDVTIMNYSSTSTTYNPFGIRVTGGIGYYVYHNTIDMSGTMANVGSAASMSACVLVTATTVDSVFVRNNIFVNRTIHNIAGSYSYIYYLPSSTWTGVRYCDYNHYFIGGNYPYFAYRGSAIQTFAAWKTAVSPIDSNSTFGNVTFVGVRNAYIGGPSVGDPLLIKPSFTGMPDEDIDGEYRDPITNYAGADIAVPTGFDIAENLPFTLLKGGDPFTLAFQPVILGFVDEVNRGNTIGDANIYQYQWYYNNAPLASTPGVREVNRNTVVFVNPANNLSGEYYATITYGSTTLTTNVCQLTIDPLQPTLVAPANDTDDKPLNVLLQWTNVPAATSYQVQVSTSPLFTTIVFDTIVTTNSVVPSGLTYSTTYFWRVAGRQGTTSGLWTQPWAFTTRVAIYPCVLVSPVNAQTFVEVNPVLAWQQNVDASSYRVQISTDIAFINIVLDAVTPNNVYTSPVTLQYLTTYY
ncbi:MAG: right-handed parallel beta-helix repeat-containing protein, partial [Ignavibacteria bacterium]|nr:right-handed parallel beta-helix repeat-containing protein [Ignavibacteria bacterium]